MTETHSLFRKSLSAVRATTTLIVLSAGLLLFVSPASGQSRRIQLRPGQPVTGVLTPGARRDYLLPLKQGQYAEIRLENRPTDIDLQLLTLDGAPVDGMLDVAGDEILSFTAERTAIYKVRVYREKDFVPAAVQPAQNAPGVRHAQSKSKGRPMSFRLTYTSSFLLPGGLPLVETKTINDYIVRIYKAHEDDPGAFVILKNGRQAYAKRGSRNVSTFSFDVLYDEKDKANADLVKPGRDITGSGSPGLMIGEYTGGAHCCFVLHVFELGPTLHIIPALFIGNGDGIEVMRLPASKGLAIVTNDDTFAYWHTSYAQSPQPQVILRLFPDGAYRPDFQLMRKPAPPWDELSKEAKENRAELLANAKEPYRKDDQTSDLPPFWGRMLDLIYTGHEDLAWKYFDEVWPPKKLGKTLFARDFKQELSQSRYWKARNYKGS